MSMPKLTLTAEGIHSRKLLDSETETSLGYAKETIRRISQMELSNEERLNTMVAELKAFDQSAHDLRLNDDDAGLRQLASQLFRRAQELSRPIIVMTAQDQVRNVFNAPESTGWASATIDLLITYLQPAEIITGPFSYEEIQTSQRTINRLALIEAFRLPHHNPDSWLREHTRSDLLRDRDRGDSPGSRPSLRRLLKRAEQM